MEALFVLFAVIVVVVIVAGIVSAEKRRKELAALAAGLGLQFAPDDPFDLPNRHRRMLAFSAGHSRRAYNTMFGHFNGPYVLATDYKYTTGSGKNQTTHIRTYVIVHTEKQFANLQMRPENFLDTIAAWAGFDDIDFEFKEFNDAFYVRCDNKKFAYDVLNPQMMEFLLNFRPLHMEMSGTVMLLHFGRALRPDEIEPLIRTGQEIHRLLPTYI